MSKSNSEYIQNRLGFKIEKLLEFPKYLHIETINACNARCVMCGINFDNKDFKLIDDNLFEKIVEELSLYSDHIEKVMPYLDGEPLMDKKIFKRVSSLKKAGIKTVNLATNASLLSEKNIQACLDSGLDEIYITIDSMNPRIYETIRKGLRFEEVLKNTKNLIKFRDDFKSPLMIRLQLISQNGNQGEEDDFVNYWREYLKESDQVVIQKAHNWGQKISPSILNSYEQDVSPCIALWGTFVCHSNGLVPLCCIDTESFYQMGSLGKKSIYEIWTSQEFQDVRKKHLNNLREKMELCKGCNLWQENKREIF